MKTPTTIKFCDKCMEPLRVYGPIDDKPISCHVCRVIGRPPKGWKLPRRIPR